MKVKIFFTLGPSGVHVKKCLNRKNYNKDNGDDDDDDESSDTEEDMFSSLCKWFSLDFSMSVWIYDLTFRFSIYLRFSLDLGFKFGIRFRDAYNYFLM